MDDLVVGRHKDDAAGHAAVVWTGGMLLIDLVE
jgi:hypothetical protein